MRKVLIECTQEIPCNPCAQACPRGAITVAPVMTALPSAEPSKCNGCGICVAACPGQACFLIDPDYSETHGTVDFPYEYLPMPKAGDTVRATDRDGRQICEAVILSVASPARFDRTAVVRMAVAKEYLNDARGFVFAD